VLEPLDLIVRLCAAVPAPRLHLLRYFGIPLDRVDRQARVLLD